MDYSFENKAIAAGFRTVCGTDEAGRGPLAGPVCAAAVILPRNLEMPGLNDSKKLTAKKRDVLFDLIKEKAVAHAVAFATVEEIETLNILNAAFLAMRRAIAALNPPAETVLVDGNLKIRGLETPCLPVVGGDGLSPSIAAASILAKVSRDRLLTELHETYPQYGFARHKGYGTGAHMAAIREFGPCPEHRPSFLKNILG
ncbi:MAG: ribonuclease HII [Oscillospiraceae bacterium]|nr:ribonuclease HII [Oscillospiraceae bacterium]